MLCSVTKKDTIEQCSLKEQKAHSLPHHLLLLASQLLRLYKPYQGKLRRGKMVKFIPNKVQRLQVAFFWYICQVKFCLFQCSFQKTFSKKTFSRKPLARLFYIFSFVYIAYFVKMSSRVE